jgi:DNA-directed RNA polymerase subunit RPC12/RpoP
MAPPDGEDEGRFLNYYRCEECSHEWADEWSCQSGDECPECGARDITPYKSEDLDGGVP